MKEIFTINNKEVSEQDFWDHQDKAYIRWKKKMKLEKPRAIFPCKNCLTFSMCYNKQHLECPLLYKWIIVGIFYHRRKSSKLNYRKRKLERTYKRKLLNYSITNTHKKHPILHVTWSVKNR